MGGAAAGFVGFLALPADVTSLVTLSLRTIRQVGVEYGFSLDTSEEQSFCLAVLMSASANTMEEKVGAQVLLAQLTRLIATNTWKAMTVKAAGIVSKEAAVIAVRSLAKQVGINITKRKALEAIPVIGLLVGAATSGTFLRDVGIGAQMAYRERWLSQRGYSAPLATNGPPEVGSLTE